MNKKSKLLLKRAIINKKNTINFPIKISDPLKDFVNNESDYRYNIDKVFNYGDFIEGEQVSLLEDNLKKYNNSKYCITCGNGTDALYLSLLALNIGKGDKVITSVFSWISSASVIALTGATPVFCDIDEKDFNIDVDKIENLIDDDVKAIIPVSLFGKMYDYDKINDIAQKYNLYVIEDGAQSFGAKYDDDIMSCNSSLIGCTSFYPTKILGCYGDGGAVFTNDDILAEKIRALKSHGLTNDEHKYIGINSRLDTIQAAVLNTKLSNLNESLIKRRKIAEIYNEAFNKLSKITLPDINDDYRIWSQYCILLSSKELRDEIYEGLRQEDIHVKIYYSKPLHKNKCFNYLNDNNRCYPIAEKTSDTIISLPCYDGLTSEEQKYIISTLKKIYNNILYES